MRSDNLFRIDRTLPCHVLLTCLSIAMFLLHGCSSLPAPSKKPAESQQAAIQPPTDLTVEALDSSAKIRWSKPAIGPAPSSYFVYAIRKAEFVEAAVESYQPLTSEPFLGDTNPDDPAIEFLATGLANATPYFIFVRSLDAHGRMSTVSDRREIVCLPRGEFQLFDRTASAETGFSFVMQQSVDLRDAAVDLFFLSRQGVDYLCSPTRLDGIYRENSLILLPYRGTLRQVGEQSTQFMSHVAGDRISIREGDWVYLIMPGKTAALLEVKTIAGEKEKRAVRLFYVYSPLAGQFPL